MKLILAFVLFGVSTAATISQAADQATIAEVGGDMTLRAPSSLTGTVNGVSRKRYPGGADEDDLQVQATLPIPSRTFDGAATNAAIESGAAETPAATDD